MIIRPTRVCDFCICVILRQLLDQCVTRCVGWCWMPLVFADESVFVRTWFV